MKISKNLNKAVVNLILNLKLNLLKENINIDLIHSQLLLEAENDQMIIFKDFYFIINFQN